MGIGNIADTGMQAAMSNMEVISNNIANANTVGFKKSYINFADIFPSTNGAAGNQIGLGVEVSSINQNFASGGAMQGNGDLDLSIINQGFFTLSNPTTGQISYTRAGSFVQDPSGYITVLGSNQRLQGYKAVNGSIPPGSAISDLTFNNSILPAQASTNVKLAVNLDSGSTVPSVTPFDPTDSNSYNNQCSSYVFDSLGNQHTVTTYYLKTGTNAWTANVYVDNASAGTSNLTFNDSGALTAGGTINASFAPTNGATTPQNFTMTLANTTQVAGTFQVNTNQHDGYVAGKFTNISIDGNGMVKMLYSNGQNILAGQVALATFPSMSGLADIGNMQWLATSQSGDPVYNTSTSTSNIRPNSLEKSNVDLTSEMVSLINAQHAFQANAQVEQTYSDVMKTVIQL